MKKAAIIIFLAGLTTTSLFAFMAFLISSEKVEITQLPDNPIIDVASLPDDSLVESKPKKLVQPPEPPPPLPSTVEPTEAANSGMSLVYTPTVITMPNTTIAGAGLGHQAEKEARPIVRVNPKYPISAARDGIEGWVKLSFDINPIGEVINIQIIDAHPKRTFDKAAKQALRKWKYRAKSVEGKAVTQHNFTVQLDFTMSKTS